MSSISYLLGHFEALDWRPLQFVDLPSTISCDLCAVVPENIFRLECFHSLCEGCYQSVLRNNRLCPIDKQGFCENEVEASQIRTARLQKLEVRCCNFAHGCNFVGPMERMKSHFLKDCEFHALSCKRCCATVLRKDIISHYMEKQCGTQNTSIRSEDAGVDNNVVGIGKEINASLADVADRLRAIEDQLNSHTVGIDTTKECVVSYAEILRTIQEGQGLSSEGISNVVTRLGTVTEALSSFEDQHGNQVASADELKGIGISNRERLNTLVELQREVCYNVFSFGEDCKQCSENVQAMSKRIQDILFSSIEDKLSCILQYSWASIGFGNDVAFCHLEDVDELEKKAKEEMYAETYSDVFMLCGYSVKLSVAFKQYDGIMYIGVFLHICRGPNDSLLKWPFFFPYTLILVHPTDEKKSIECRVDMASEFKRFPQCFVRPVGSVRNGVGNPKLCELQDALNGGFVFENSITVGVTLVERRG